MIDALIGGTLHAKPVQRTGASGKSFTTAKLIAATRSGKNTICNVIAFDSPAQAALLALDAGDSVAVAGPLTVKAWTDDQGTAKPSLDIVAHHVLSPFHVCRMRRDVQEVQT